MALPGAEGNRKGDGRAGGSGGDAKRRERAARKLEQQEAEVAAGVDDGSSIMTLKYSFQEPVGEVRITEDWSGDGNGLAGLQWPGGVMLCRYMDSRQVFPEHHFSGRRVIEVGAGCGLTSIYAALRGADVTITDMDPGKCVDNVDMNLGPRGLADRASVRRLEWDCAEELAEFEPPYDVLIVGDCLYEEACISPLLNTMWALSGPETEIFLSGVVGRGILASFLRQVDHFFEREIVDTSNIDTLVEVLDRPLGEGTSGDEATESAQTAAAAAAAAGSSKVCPTTKTSLDTAPCAEEAEEGRAQGGGDGDGTPGGTIGADVPRGAGLEVAGLGGVERQRPGQRALLRLRKKCDAGAGE
ncbi:unnamed protein product [Pylaiella littoralis]